MEIECTSYNFRLFAIFMPKIVRFKFDVVITKIILLVFLRHDVVTRIQRFLCTKCEVSTALRFQVNCRHGSDGQTDRHTDGQHFMRPTREGWPRNNTTGYDLIIHYDNRTILYHTIEEFNVD